MDFVGFPSIARLRRDMIITEKIDGTNAQVLITDQDCFPLTSATWTYEPGHDSKHVARVGDCFVWVGSRTRWITPEDDNFGFAAWVKEHAEELVEGLGPGRHYGEWWGQGIQRKYGMDRRVFSLFNVWRWIGKQGEVREFFPWEEMGKRKKAPVCCDVVPILYRGPFLVSKAEEILARLTTTGSTAAYQQGSLFPPKPEGVVVYHCKGKHSYKMTIENDEGKE